MRVHAVHMSFALYYVYNAGILLPSAAF